MHFEWDPKKREANLEKHGIDFLRAVRIFEGFVHEWQDTLARTGGRADSHRDPYPARRGNPHYFGTEGESR